MTSNLEQVREQVEENLKSVKGIETIAKEALNHLLDGANRRTYDKIVIEKEKGPGVYIIFDSDDRALYVGKHKTDVLGEIRASIEKGLLPCFITDDEMREKMKKEGLGDIVGKILKEFAIKKMPLDKKEKAIEKHDKEGKIREFSEKELRASWKKLDNGLQATLVEQIFLEGRIFPWNRRKG